MVKITKVDDSTSMKTYESNSTVCVCTIEKWKIDI